MSCTLHTWRSPGRDHATRTFADAAAAVVHWKARRPAGVALLASRSEVEPRPPTKWEAAEGRLLMTQGAKASAAGSVPSTPLPHGLNTDYEAVPIGEAPAPPEDPMPTEPTGPSFRGKGAEGGKPRRRRADA